MVRHALNRRRDSGLDLKIDTAASSPGYTTIRIMVFADSSRRQSLPHSRHHQLRRSSSVSSSSTVSSLSSSSCISSSLSAVGIGGSKSDGGGEKRTEPAYDCSLVIVGEAGEASEKEGKRDPDVTHVG
ncbi:hypothetical protein VTH82DRAFT_6746 [Thermothelomyces myriococcoides]